MQIEIHFDDAAPAEKAIPRFFRWFEMLETAGLRPFRTETNHNPCVRGLKPIAAEYSFLNTGVSHFLTSV